MNNVKKLLVAVAALTAAAIAFAAVVIAPARASDDAAIRRHAVAVASNLLAYYNCGENFTNSWRTLVIARLYQGENELGRLQLHVEAVRGDMRSSLAGNCNLTIQIADAMWAEVVKDVTGVSLSQEGN